MATPPIPVKTPDGQAELNQRQRRLSQRHRTVLLLVDGRRTVSQVRYLALQAGATESCFGELLDLGLIALPPEPPQPPITTVPIRPQPDGRPVEVDIPLDDLVPPPTPGRDDAPESLLPAARTLQPESVLDTVAPEPVPSDFDLIDAGEPLDAPLEEAREILLNALRREAPLAGSLTMRKLRRARTRDDLAGLIDEVELRIVKPNRSLAAQQVLRRARHLLGSPGDSRMAG